MLIVYQEIIAQFRDRPVTLDFSGVDQLTDIVFRIFLEHWNEKTFKLVQSVSLRGCVNITDIGIQWMAKCFPSLKQVWGQLAVKFWHILMV